MQQHADIGPNVIALTANIGVGGQHWRNIDPMLPLSDSDNWLANDWQLVRYSSPKNKAKYVKK